jgi:DNA-binding transcriptional ArsR family regulator
MADERLARALRTKKRRQILQLLVKKEFISVNEISKSLKMSESLASRHLKMLYDMGLLGYNFEPPEKYYFIKIKSLSKMLLAYQNVVKEMSR